MAIMCAYLARNATLLCTGGGPAEAVRKKRSKQGLRFVQAERFGPTRRGENDALREIVSPADIACFNLLNVGYEAGSD